MAQLSDRIENVLNEARMLLLGGQVLLGFTYRICFEPAFDRISQPAQVAEITALGLMTAGLGWLVWPAAYHRIAERGRETERIHSLTTVVLDWALLPFCIGLGLSFYPVLVVLRVPHAPWIAAAIFVLSLSAWYGSGLLRRGGEKRRKVRAELAAEEQKQHKSGDSRVAERIKKVLIECRMALPGAQAFLGFQFAIVFTEDFGRLPRSSQWIHFASLIFTTFAIVLLIAPAAYHRLAEAGEDTEHFHMVASYLLLAALVFLAPGMAGDLYIVFAKVSGSKLLGMVVGGALLMSFYVLWFAISALKRRK